MASSKREPNMTRADLDPRGGLSASGRKKLKASGRDVKKGVTKAESEMSPDEMQRKAQFLRRHYGKDDIPPLTDDSGKPTRYALQARAWGESVPKTKEDVKKLAAKGSDLLKKYQNRKMNNAVRKAAKS